MAGAEYGIWLSFLQVHNAQELEMTNGSKVRTKAQGEPAELSGAHDMTEVSST